MDPTKRDRVLRVDQVCEYLVASESFVRDLFDRGILRGFRLGKRKGIRIYASSVDAFEEKRSNGRA